MSAPQKLGEGNRVVMQQPECCDREPLPCKRLGFVVIGLFSVFIFLMKILGGLT